MAYGYAVQSTDNGRDPHVSAPETRDGEACAAVEVVDLVKRYSGMPTDAVGGISFRVEPGEIFGLLGPNGAGKTTTVGVLTTRVRPTSGRASIGGADVAREPVLARARLAVVPQRSNLDRDLSIRDNLIFHAAYHGVPARERTRRADELLDLFGLRARSKDKPDLFSGGQEQRVMIARALMHNPQVVFLDEPSTGLDPAARLFVWDRLRELTERGVTIVLTTHDMEEAAALADRIAIMDHGKLLAEDDPGTLIRSLPGAATLDLAAVPDGERDVDEVVAALRALPGVETVDSVQAQPDGGEYAAAERRFRVFTTGSAPILLVPAAAQVFATCGLTLTDVKVGEPSLEDVFIHLTGRALR